MDRLTMTLMGAGVAQYGKVFLDINITIYFQIFCQTVFQQKIGFSTKWNFSQSVRIQFFHRKTE